MKKETKKKFKNITLSVIDLFLGIPESIINSFDRGEFYRTLQGNQTDQYLTCSNIAKIIANLKRSNYISIEKSSHGESIVFTNKAKLVIVDRLANKISSGQEFCLVSFDIPEKLKNNRDRFRRTIKRMGFCQIQKSLWVINKRIGDLVELAAIEYKVNDYVVYFISSESNINDYIKKMLHI